jgi:predicted transcriptional regulator YdeE
LNLLKDFTEDGEVHSKLSWLGEKSFKGTKFIGVQRECSTDDISTVMSKDFENLANLAANIEGADVTKSFSQYHKFDFVKKQAKYTVGIPVSKLPSSISEGFITGEIPATKIYTLEHRGPYKHLGNAWVTMYNMKRSKEFKAKKSIHPFETYGNNPADTKENDLITYLNFAIK